MPVDESTTKLAEDAEPRCPWCRHELEPGARFCPHCGNTLTDAGTSFRAAFQFNWKNNLVVATLVVAAVFAIVYRSVEAGHLMQTYTAFVGFPLLIGVLTTYLVRPKSGVGATVKVTTVILCIVCTLLGEGTVCILMAAPIFYALAIAGYGVVAACAKLIGPRGRSGPMMLVLLPFVAGKLTSTPDGIHNPQTITVHTDTFVAAPRPVVWRTLLHGNLVSTDFPLFLRLGFPLPTKLERGANGLTRLTFDPGSEAWPGTNVIISRAVQDNASHRLTFIVQEDGTKLARWLTFRRTTFLVEEAAGGCRVRQTTTFQQRMQPGLYWNPLQSFAMTQMHHYALAQIKELAEVESL